MNIQILEMIEGARQAKGLTVIIDVFRVASHFDWLLLKNILSPASWILFSEHQIKFPACSAQLRIFSHSQSSLLPLTPSKILYNIVQLIIKI